MAIKGAIIGDILGSQYEFSRPKDLDWENVPLVNNNFINFTDDTVTTLAIKKSVDTGSDLIKTMVDLCSHYPQCGFGGMFYDWVFNSIYHFPYNSYGNGSAMRVSYIGEYFDSIDDVKKYSEKTAIITHNHPEGIKGAVVTAACIWMAKHGKSKNEIYDYVLDMYPSNKYKYGIDKDLKYIRKNYIPDETCQNSVPVAMRCFYESYNYESFIRNVFSFKCDSDTIAAIGGGVAEEYYGEIFNNCNALLDTFLTDELKNIYNGVYL